MPGDSGHFVHGYLESEKGRRREATWVEKREWSQREKEKQEREAREARKEKKKQKRNNKKLQKWESGAKPQRKGVTNVQGGDEDESGGEYGSSENSTDKWIECEACLDWAH